MPAPREVQIPISLTLGEVPGLYLLPTKARAIYLFAHGAGAGMRHAFMESMAQALARERLATLRYEFPYIAQGRRAPNHTGILQATVREALRMAQKLGKKRPIFAGGKSMGGRITALAASAGFLPGLCGLCYLGFPFHAARDPKGDRARELRGIPQPQLFVQGSRDAFGDPRIVNEAMGRIGERATLHWIDQGDHSFELPSGNARTADEVFREAADAVSDWLSATFKL